MRVIRKEGGNIRNYPNSRFLHQCCCLSSNYLGRNAVSLCEW
jgi:hypothetical protein